ncbi:Dynamin-A, partial [Aduncisulcus paluster]
MQLVNLIPVINKLQDVFSVLGADSMIDLPQIVVVGSQSSGKSSVLESIVHRDFLPRGSGIVTRRPLILQLYTTSSSSDPMTKPAEYGEFLHKPGVKYTNFHDIRDEISKETDRLTGTNKAISSEPIRLKIFSPRVLNLTLVDLPGIAKIAVGDQPKDIEMMIKKMILKYIAKPNALILAVTAANTDIATSDALQIAAQVDPKKERTLGILTKLDLMDKGTDAKEVLSGRFHPLDLGWIGVVNRSQADIESGKAIGDAQASEEAFFASHPAYSMIATRMGSKYLADTLSRVLMKHIKRTLPALSARIDELYAHSQAELAKLGTDIPDCQEDRQSMVLRLLNNYAQMFVNMIEGRAGTSKGELRGGARISFIFHEVYNSLLDRIKSTDALSMDEILTVLRNASGSKPSLFIPPHAFELFAKRAISRLESPSVRCVDLVCDELSRIARHCPPAEMRRYTALTSRTVHVAENLIKKLHAPTRVFV